MRVRGIDCDILLDGKSYKNKYANTLIYDISYKTFMGSKPLHISFDKIDGFNEINKIRHLVLLDYKKLMKFVIGLNIL